MANVKIVMHGHGRGDVFVDGHKVEGVRRVEFSASVEGAANVLTLEMIPERVEIEGPADVLEVPMVEVTTHADVEPQYVSVGVNG